MKNVFFKIALILFIVVHAVAPLIKLAVWGYGWPELLSDLYKTALIVILSAAVLHLYNLRDRGE